MSVYTLIKVFIDQFFLNSIKSFFLAVICPGHNFLAKYVIHCNLPTYGSANALELMEKAVKNILTLADEKNLKSIVIPSITTGTYV